MVHRTLLPRLEIVSLRSLILHEDVEMHRVERIMERFRAERSLKNPPVVGRNPRYRRLIVLDGASRVTAARRLGLPHFLVQIVPYPSPDIGLDPWHHIVVGMDWKVFIERASAIQGVRLELTTLLKADRALAEHRALASVRAPGKKPAVLTLAHPRRTGLGPIRELTRLYATDPGLHRVREDQLPLPEEWLGEERVLVLFPRFTQDDIVRLALRHEDRLPMGITRHTVPNRALRVHYPLHRLRSPAPLPEKRRRLRAFLEERWESGRIRHYPEATTVYDE
jgi:hypothetical protein